MGKPWFRPKRYGYGAGLPCSWEGWLVLAGFLIAMPGSHLLLRALLPPLVALIAWIGVSIVLIVGLIFIARAKTDGGWRWRNGSD